MRDTNYVHNQWQLGSSCIGPSRFRIVVVITFWSETAPAALPFVGCKNRVKPSLIFLAVHTYCWPNIGRDPKPDYTHGPRYEFPGFFGCRSDIFDYNQIVHLVYVVGMPCLASNRFFYINRSWCYCYSVWPLGRLLYFLRNSVYAGNTKFPEFVIRFLSKSVLFRNVHCTMYIPTIDFGWWWRRSLIVWIDRLSSLDILPMTILPIVLINIDTVNIFRNIRVRVTFLGFTPIVHFSISRPFYCVEILYKMMIKMTFCESQEIFVLACNRNWSFIKQ